MFNLEQAISDWRRQMLAAGIKTPVPLEELEIHLREDIERQMKSGLNAQEAFEIAVQKIGPGSHELKREFKKIDSAPMDDRSGSLMEIGLTLATILCCRCIIWRHRAHKASFCCHI